MHADCLACERFHGYDWFLFDDGPAEGIPQTLNGVVENALDDRGRTVLDVGSYLH